LHREVTPADATRPGNGTRKSFFGLRELAAQPVGSG
jgi:hypothetical protein